MVRAAHLVLLPGLLGLAACGSDSGGGTVQQPAKEATFHADIAPIFANCGLCHHVGDASGIDLTHPFDPTTGIINRPNTWTGAAAKLIVDPGHVENSFLIDKVARTDLDVHVEGSPMPWNIPALDATQIMAIRQWIQDGAMNDASYTTNVAPIFGDGMFFGSRGGSCGYCYYEGTGQLPDFTHP